jgi:hypothetical protein
MEKFTRRKGGRTLSGSCNALNKNAGGGNLEFVISNRIEQVIRMHPAVN